MFLKKGLGVCKMWRRGRWRVVRGDKSRLGDEKEERESESAAECERNSTVKALYEFQIPNSALRMEQM